MSVRLFVLGALKHQDAHGYEIQELAKQWGIDQWAKINYSSIYHALGKLKEEGKIDELNVEQEGGRPPRQVYRINDKGKEEFFKLLQETYKEIYPDKNPIHLGLAFIHEVSPGDRVELLKARLSNLEYNVQGMNQKLAFLSAYKNEFRWAITSVELAIKVHEAEIEWVKKLMEEIESW